MAQKVTENNSQKTVFGILGCGVSANFHASALLKIDNAILKGAFDPNQNLCQEFTNKYGITAYNSYEEMLEDGEIDAVCICTPSFLHTKNAIDALNADKHAVIEKPMAVSTADADKIIDACEKSGKQVAAICQLRFSEDVKKIKQLLKENAFGKVSICSLSMNYYRTREYYSESGWRGSLSLDGGVLFNQGVHGIDIIEYIMGPIKKVCGKTATLSHNIEAPDTAVAIVEFESGILGVIEASTCAYPGFDRRLKIQGDTGYVVLKESSIEKLMLDGKMIIDGDNSEAIVDTANDPTKLRCGLHKLQLKNFIAAINGTETLISDCYEGKKALTVIEKIYNIT